MLYCAYSTRSKVITLRTRRFHSKDRRAAGHIQASDAIGHGCRHSTWSKRVPDERSLTSFLQGLGRRKRPARNRALAPPLLLAPMGFFLFSRRPSLRLILRVLVFGRLGFFRECSHGGLQSTGSAAEKSAWERCTALQARGRVRRQEVETTSKGEKANGRRGMYEEIWRDRYRWAWERKMFGEAKGEGTWNGGDQAVLAFFHATNASMVEGPADTCRRRAI